MDSLYLKTTNEHKFTSTGVKFWKHMDKMNNYRKGTNNSIISTHISPEGSCNLNCSYCSVKKRDKHFRIEFHTIMDYVEKLCHRGLKAVILTGGGEPTLYPYFNELVKWLKHKQLSVALITNGTRANNVDCWNEFSWVRISINIFKDWEKIISIPKISGTLGCSFVYTGQTLEEMKKIAKFAHNLGAKYVRILPDCLYEQDKLKSEYKRIYKILKSIDDEIFFCQYKIHNTPLSDICHQAYFRPYLSEIDNGTVYPCDSIVLNDGVEMFDRKYQICKASEILDFLDGKIKMKHNIKIDCRGCVFTNNINMLDDWKKYGKIKNEFEDDIEHKDFI
jgi:MoaA/NifB/PqqE/SkfB family radical SAM enzyme